jgi:hypothetical protein
MTYGDKARVEQRRREVYNSLVMVDPYFVRISETCRLSSEQEREIRSKGFVVIPEFVPEAGLAALQSAYDSAMSAGEGDDYRVASSTTRLHDFVNRGAAFDSLYLHPSLLAAGCVVIGSPFKLSSMLGRTLRPRTAAQELHADLERGSDAFPMVGFIIMVDEFRADNGATRFVQGSHLLTEPPGDAISDLRANVDGQVLACGMAGSVAIFNASIWHGHTANDSDVDRRSIQGYFVPRSARSGWNVAARMKAETLDRIGSLARYLLAV